MIQMHPLAPDEMRMIKTVTMSLMTP